jgi:hypothetical protein
MIDVYLMFIRVDDLGQSTKCDKACDIHGRQQGSFGAQKENSQSFKSKPH